MTSSSSKRQQSRRDNKGKAPTTDVVDPALQLQGIEDILNQTHYFSQGESR